LETTRPLISVCVGSNRPGGIDIMLAGLVDQTFKDFEVIFVDGRYHHRHLAVLSAVKASGLSQPFFHVPNHRYGATHVFGTTCAGYNTGFALAAGTYVVMLLDYSYVPPGWLAAHVEHLKAGRIVMGPHEYRTITKGVTVANSGSVEPRPAGEELVEFTREVVDRYPNPILAGNAILRQRQWFDEISLFAEPFKKEDLGKFPVEESDAKCAMTTGPQDWAYFNTKNESFLLEDVLEINGMDEHYDLGRGPGDPDLGMRLAVTGRQFWVVKEAIVHCLNPRRLMPNANILVEDGKLPPPFHERWNVAEGNAYFEKRRILQILGQEALKAPNPFHIRELRERLWKWRELSQDLNTVIPKNIVSDVNYFSKIDIRLEGNHVPNIPHLYDPRTQLNYIIWHKDPNLERFIRHLIETVKPDRWVETGTHMGWTSVWIAENYPSLPIYTVEIDSEFFQKSSENLAQWPQVHVAHKSSPDFLEGLRPLLETGTTIFWLDAHWWPPVPLRRECKIVASLPKYVCLLDDFSCWDPDFSGDTFYGRAPGGGSAHLNDLYYVGPELGYSCWRPNYQPQPGYKGYGLFCKGVDYTPPADLMKFETLLPP